MRNLLHANLRRMFRSRAFLIALLAQLVYTALIVLVCWDQYRNGGYHYTLESILSAGFGLMGYLPVPSLIAAPLLCFHLGTDYSDKTLRNKLIVGHTRQEVYLADMLTCMFTVLGLDTFYLVLSGLLCVYPVIGMSGRLLQVSPGQMLAWIAVALLARMAWAAIIKLLVTALGSRTNASIAGLLLVVAMMFLCKEIFSRMEYIVRHPEMTDPERCLVLWRLAVDILPTGQYIQIARLDTPNLWRMPLLSLVVIAVSTGVGLVVFRRKDLK